MSVQMQPSDVTQADLDEFTAHLARWVQLCLDGDFEQLVDKLVTEDVGLLPPDHPA
jgi:hypothetical protein